MFSGEAANTNFLVFSLTWQWFDQTVDPTVVWPDVYGLIRLHREPNIYPVRGKHANYYTNDSVETGYILSECCLSCEQHFIYIMTRTTFHLYHDKNNISFISWQEQHFIYIMTRTTFHLYHDKSNISSISWQEQHFIYIMTRTTFYLYHDKNNISSISWQEQHFIYIMTRTTFYLYHDKNNILSISWQEQHFIYIMTRTNYLMRWWWCWHCTEPTPTVGFKNNQQKNMFLIHTILTQSQPVFALTPKCGVEKQPLLILWFDPIVNQILNLLPSERAREPLL